jgi:pyruvate dehydrogenase E1 component
VEHENTQQQTLSQDGTAERDRWIESLEFVIESVLRDRETSQVPLLLSRLVSRLRESGVAIPLAVSTPYINTIPVENEPAYPGDREIERRIKSYTRWNAMAMVVK